MAKPVDGSKLNQTITVQLDYFSKFKIVKCFLGQSDPKYIVRFTKMYTFGEEVLDQQLCKLQL